MVTEAIFTCIRPWAEISSSMSTGLQNEESNIDHPTEGKYNSYKHQDLTKGVFGSTMLYCNFKL